MMKKMVVDIIGMLRRDIIHSYKSEKRQIVSVSLPGQCRYGMHGKYQYRSRDWSSEAA